MASRLNRITKSIKQRIIYSDFTMNLDKDSAGELVILTNQQAVIQSIRNLVLIFPTEIPYQPLVGSVISRSLFNFVDNFTTQQIQDSIKNVIQNYEPRAQNVQVVVNPNQTQNYVNVNILFQLVNTNQTVSVPTIPVRIR